MLMFMILFAVDGTALWQIGETEIYQNLSPSQVAITADERVFLLDSQEHRVLVFDKAEPVTRFGKKGQGPGEMMFPQRLYLDGDRLYINDFMKKALLIFDLEGNYLDQLDVKDVTGNMVRVENGWVSGTWSYFGKNIDPGQLLLADEQFENQKVILDMRPPGFTPQENTFSIEIGKPLPMNPAQESNVLAVSEDGTRIFLARPGPKATIHVFDHEGRALRVIQKDWPRLPFDEAWGQHRIDEMNNRPQRGNFKLEWEGDFPESFPHIRNMVSFGDQLFVQRWRAWPKEKPLVSVLDFSGADVATDLPGTAMSRLVSLRDGHAYVLTMDPEEESAGLAKVARDALAAFLDANPIIDVSVGGGVMIVE